MDNYFGNEDEHLLPAQDFDKKEDPIFGSETYVRFGRFRVKAIWLKVFLAVFSVLSGVGMVVTLPLYTNRVLQIGSNPYFVLLYPAFYFCIVFLAIALAYKYLVEPDMRIRSDTGWMILVVVGVLSSLNGIMVVSASPSSRTPPYLQAILSTLTIPFTVFFRLIILRKGVSVARLICTFGVIVGVFISSEPTVFNLDGSGGNTGQSVSPVWKVVWPMIFGLGFAPVGISNAYQEREMKKNNQKSSSLVFLFWTQLFSFIAFGLMFWVDLIPSFGQSAGIADFGTKLTKGFRCHLFLDPSCYDVPGYCALFILAYCSANLGSLLLIKYAEGAVFMVVVTAAITPCGALFWSFFKPTPYFRWAPGFTVTTAYTLAGLALLVPAVILYDIFYSREKRREKLMMASQDNDL